MRTPGMASPQSGAALLLMMLGLFLTIASQLVSSLNSNQHRLDKPFINASVLQQAKEGLIAYALLSDQTDGQAGLLPCPDLDGDGMANQPCDTTGQSQTGWLPWQTLKIPKLQDADGYCLRYTVSGHFTQSVANKPIAGPPMTEGHFIIIDVNGQVLQGVNNNDRALAVIFASGRAIGLQTRTRTGGTVTACGTTLMSAPINQSYNHLDTINGINNANGVSSSAVSGAAGSLPLPTSNASLFITGPETDDFNDNLLWIKPSDYDPQVLSRMP